MSSHDESVDEAVSDEDRRSDLTIRQQIQQLLDLIRDFYSTCHMVAVGQLSPAQAKARALDVERKLQAMMNTMLARIDALPEDTGLGAAVDTLEDGDLPGDRDPADSDD